MEIRISIRCPFFSIFLFCFFLLFPLLGGVRFRFLFFFSFLFVLFLFFLSSFFLSRPRLTVGPPSDEHFVVSLVVALPLLPNKSPPPPNKQKNSFHTVKKKKGRFSVERRSLVDFGFILRGRPAVDGVEKKRRWILYFFSFFFILKLLFHNQSLLCGSPPPTTSPDLCWFPIGRDGSPIEVITK